MAKRNNSVGYDLDELRRRHAEYKAKQNAASAAKAEKEALADPVSPAAAPKAAEAKPFAPEAELIEPEVTAPAAEEPAADIDEEPVSTVSVDEEPYYDEAEDFDEEDIGDENDADDEDEEDYDDGSFFTPIINVSKTLFGKARGLFSRKNREDDEELYEDEDEGPADEEISGDTEADETDEPAERKSIFSFFRGRRDEEDFDAEDDEEYEDEEDDIAIPEIDADIIDEPAADEDSATEEPAADEPADIEDEPTEIVDEPAEIEEQTADIIDEPVDIADEPAEIESEPADIIEDEPAERTVIAEFRHGDYEEPMLEGDVIVDDEEYTDDEEDYEDEEYDDGAEDDSSEPSIGKKILGFFFEITPDDMIDEDDYEVSDPEDAEEDEQGYDDSLFVNDHTPLRSEEDLIYMEEQKKTGTLTDIMSEGMDEKILSRRERRELRMKQEAELAAAQANEALAEEDVPAAEEAPAASAAPELDESEFAPDDPTREYRIVSRPAAPSPAPAAIEEEEDDYDDDDDDDYEYEYEEKPLTRREKARLAKEAKKASRYDDDEDDYDEDDYDDEDYDDEDDYDDYDDDEDYDDEPKSRKKSKKSSRYDDDYDDYDYDDDDYDDYDDDSPSAGHYVLGFIKYVIAIILILVVVVFGMYFADQAIDGGFAPYRFISEKVSFIGEYLPASEEADLPAVDTEDPAAAPEVTEPETGDADVGADEGTEPENTDTGSVG